MAHHQYLRILPLKTNNEIVFKRSIAKILIIMLFLKIMLIIDLDDFLSIIFFTLLFELPPEFQRHTCGPFTWHQCAAAHRLKITDLYYTVLYGKTTDKWGIGKDLQGSGNGLTQVLSQHLPRGILKNHKKPQSKQSVSWAELQTENLQKL